MEDMILKNTGNSRFLKSVANALTLYPTYESFIQALTSGTFPIDLNGINPSGVEQTGTALNKASLLRDATAALYGKTNSATPDDVFAEISSLFAEASDMIGETIYNQVSNRTYQKLTASGNWTPPSDMVGDYVFVIAIGGGGGGGSGGFNSSTSYVASSGGGGGSGYIKAGYVKVNKSTSYSYTVGAGGDGGASPSTNGYNGGTGGTTTFQSISAAGGGGGGRGLSSTSGAGGAGGNGGSGGAGGRGGSNGGTGGRGGNGMGSNGTAGSTATSTNKTAFGGTGGSGIPLATYPQILLPMLLKTSGYWGGQGGGEAVRAAGGYGGISDADGIITDGRGGEGGQYSNMVGISASGGSGQPGAIYLFYQRRIT